MAEGGAGPSPADPFAAVLAAETERLEEEALVADAEALKRTEAPHLLHALDLLLYRSMDALNGASRLHGSRNAGNSATVPTPEPGTPAPSVETPRPERDSPRGRTGPAAAHRAEDTVILDHIQLDTVSSGRIQGFLQVRGRGDPTASTLGPTGTRRPPRRSTGAKLYAVRSWPG